MVVEEYTQARGTPNMQILHSNELRMMPILQ
jgi:hypothetical protein